MVNELHERYSKLEHAELYGMVQAGNPRQVEDVADAWGSLADTASALAASVRSDLSRLQPDWIGSASNEFHYRLESVARYAQTLADEAGSIRAGLSAMANALAEARRKAEPPEPAGAMNTVVDAVVGSELGRVLPAAERQRAHQRMVTLMANLAAEYGIADHSNWPATIPDPPIQLPSVGGGVPIVAGPVTVGMVGTVGKRGKSGGRGRLRRAWERLGRGDRKDGSHSHDVSLDGGSHHVSLGGGSHHGSLGGSGTTGAGMGWSQPDHHAPIGVGREHGGSVPSSAGGATQAASAGSSSSHSSATPAPAAAAGGAPMPMAPMAPPIGPAQMGAAHGTAGMPGGQMMMGVDPGLSSQQWRAPETVEWAEAEDTDAAPPVLG